MRGVPSWRQGIRWVAALAATLVLASCTTPADSDRVEVSATTPVIADIVRGVAGDHATVHGLIPNRADPHTYEPHLKTLRAIAHSRVIFSNGLLLEEQSLTKALTANARPGAEVVPLAEHLPQAGGYQLPLVENAALDTVWLGLRVQGKTGHPDEAVRLHVESAEGPGNVEAFITGTFGAPERLLSTQDRDVAATLPQAAHTHVSWSFSAPGVYRLTLHASVVNVRSGKHLQDVGKSEYTFAVGVDPSEAATPAQRENPTSLVALDQGHEDITVDLDANRLLITGDAQATTPTPKARGVGNKPARGRAVDINARYQANETVIVVPPSTLHEVPPQPAMRFVGKPGTQVYLLAQAVLGKHVHGDLDPHVWLDPANGEAMVQMVLDKLIEVDPKARATYQRNASAYLARLREASKHMLADAEAVPKPRRYLVTTHDGYGYLAHALDYQVAGFVTPNPALEPSPGDMARLASSLDDLKVPAVFIEPNATAQSESLRSLAHGRGVAICEIFGDSFGETIATYPELLETNGRNLRQCLGGSQQAETRP